MMGRFRRILPGLKSLVPVLVVAKEHTEAAAVVGGVHWGRQRLNPLSNV